jgi:hypothetical protein
MTTEAERLEAFHRNKDHCITHMENHRIWFSPGDRYEKVLFHHCDLHGPENPKESTDIHFISCVFWGCRYFRGEKEVPNIIEAMGGDEVIHVISDEDRARAINAEGFRVL